jgi:type IV secretion system protein VirB10
MKFLDRFKRRDPSGVDPAAEADRIDQEGPGTAERVEQEGPSEAADREIPSVNARKRGSKVTSFLGMVFIGCMGLYLIYQLNSGDSRKDKLAAQREIEMAKANAVNGSLPPIVVPPRPPEPALYTPENQSGGFQKMGGVAAAAAGDNPPPPPEVNGPNNQGASQAGQSGKPVLGPWEVIRNRRQQGGMTAAFENDAVTAAEQKPAGGPAAAQAASLQMAAMPVQAAPYGAPAGASDAAVDDSSGAAGGPAHSGELASSLQPTITAGTLATKLADLTYMITKGAFMDCVLETKLDSSVPGMTSCVLSRPMYSANRKMVLLDAGSKVVGQYAGGLKQGQVRIFVLWTRIETPKGVIINLDSPGTDALGASGLDGHVDTRFWERFGGAIMLSLLDDAFAVASARSQDRDSNTTINLGNTQAASQNMATEALKSSINIPPVLRKNHGDQINIFVARDLDFRSVYAIRAQ